MRDGLVSTIIPVFNRAGMLVDAVQSVLDQTYRPIEVIIVNDGSSDDTGTVADRLASKHEEVTVIHKENTGPGPSRESGRVAATGEFIQYLDSDDYLLPGKFEAQVLGLESRPECGVSYCRARFENAEGTVLSEPWMKTGELHDEMFPGMLSGRLWGTPVPLYRKSVTDRAGPWTDLSNEEDWEYDCRIASLGVKLDYIPETLVAVRQHDQEHFGKLTESDSVKLKDRATAYGQIFDHAIAAGLTPENHEMGRFSRSLFLLSRKCGAAGLISESQALFELSRKAAGAVRGSGLDFQVYKCGASLVGWHIMGRVANVMERLKF